MGEILQFRMICAYHVMWSGCSQNCFQIKLLHQCKILRGLSCKIPLKGYCELLICYPDKKYDKI